MSCTIGVDSFGGGAGEALSLFRPAGHCVFISVAVWDFGFMPAAHPDRRMSRASLMFLGTLQPTYRYKNLLQHPREANQRPVEERPHCQPEAR